MSFDAATSRMDEFHRKRQIREVADAEAPPKASRPRLRVKQEVEDEWSKRDNDDHRQCSESELDLFSDEDNDWSNGDTRDSSYERATGEIVQRTDTAAEQVSNGQDSASRAVPQPWEDASKGDCFLTTMKSIGMGWDDIAEAWKKETGQDVAHIVWVDRWNRINGNKDNLQTLREGDSERLLAAVNDVKAALKRSRWQLVKYAMIHAGAAEYSTSFIQNEYKKLARVSRTTNTTRSHDEKRVGKGNSESITPTEDLHVADPVTSTYSAPVNPLNTSQGLRPVDAVVANIASSPNIITEADDVASASRSTVPNPNSSGIAQQEAQREGAADNRQQSERDHANGSAHVEPGSSATNAIEVDEIDSDPSAVSVGNGTAVPLARATVGSTAPEALSLSNPLATVPRSGRQLNTTTSRVGSATNRGPARFRNIHKAIEDEIARKQRKATNIHKSIEDEIARKQRKAAVSLHDSTGIKPGSLPIDSSSGSFGTLVNQKDTSHDFPSNVRQRMAMQHDGPAENGSLQANAVPQQKLPVPSQPQPASIEGEASDKQGMPQTSVQNGLPIGPAVAKPLAYQKPSDLQTPYQSEDGQPRSPMQSTENDSRDKLSMPAKVVDAQAAAGRLKKSVTTDQLQHMLRHRTVNDANGYKSWDIIARECGVTATLPEISVALEQAGYPPILNTSDPPHPAISALPNPSTESENIVAPHASAPPTPVNQQSVTPVVPTAPPRAFETPVPASTPSLDGTPNTRSKAGRPFGSKNKPKDHIREKGSSISPTHPKTPVSGQKGQLRGERSAASKAAQSAAMKAAWARRKEKAANERRDGSPRSSTTAGSSLVGSSVATFAADILAAAAANSNVALTTGSRATPPERSEALDHEPVDLLTGESMFAQHADDPAPAQAPPAKKITGAHERPERLEAEPQSSKTYIRGPYRKRTQDISFEEPRYPCPRCHKAYRNRAGLKYHEEKHPECDKEPARRDSRTDPPGHIAPKRIINKN